MHKCSQELSSDWWATPWLGFAALARYTGYSHQAAPLDCVAIHWQDTVTRLPLAPSSRLRGTAPIKARYAPHRNVSQFKHFTELGIFNYGVRYHQLPSAPQPDYIWVRFPRTGISAKMWPFFEKSRAFV